MSTNNHASSKSWWPLKSPSFTPSRDLPYDTESRPGSSSSSSPAGSGLKSFASAMGFSKSRKHDAGYPSSRPLNLAGTSYDRSRGSANSGHTAPTSNDQSCTSRKPGRPPSNSVSSTLRSESFDDEPVPRTPSDLPRNSMMSLSEDPFAASSLHSPRIEPASGSRISAYSNHSGLDVLPKGATGSPLLFSSTRDSYASSSSREMYRPTPTSPRVASPGVVEHSMYPNGSSRQRVVSVGRHDVRRPGDPHLFTPPHFTSASSTTLTDTNRLSQPSTSSLQARPPMRARGMTDVGPGQSLVQFLRSEPPSPARSSGSGSHRRTDDLVPPMLSRTESHSSQSSTGPRLVVRAASVSRPPPTAPPNLHLPPPPTEHPPFEPPTFASPLASIAPPPPPVAPLTIIRKSSNNRSPLALDDSRPPSASRLAVQVAANLDSNPITHSAHGTPRTLKKAASQSSLHKKASISSISSLKLSAEERAPRKQRSFNHPKLPLPEVPALPSMASTSTPSTPYNLSDKDKRGSSSSRRRLFSAGSIRTTSSQFPDDQMSSSHDDPAAFLARIDGQRYQQTSSFWDEDKESSGSVPPSPVTRQRSPHHDYYPQQIMSPAEMLKVEASYNRGSVYVRERGQSVASMFSLASVSTTRTAMSNLTLGGSGHGHGGASAGPGPSVSSPRHSNPNSPVAPPVESHYLDHAQHREETHSPPSLHPHPHTHPSGTASRPQRPPAERPSPMPCYSPPTPEINSLPAPPRRRANSRPSTSPAPPTSMPHPVSRAPSSSSVRTALSQRSQEFIRTRKSLMRKPSFLEIDDEAERDARRLIGLRAGGSTFVPEPDSFLDLRPSIDNVRGIEAPS